MKIENLTLISAVGDGKETACLMSVRALLDGRGLTDSHPSRVIRAIGIRLNDGSWWTDDAERTRVLMPLALDERLCATRCDVSLEAEKKRADMCANWALSFAAPHALESAALALEGVYPERAAELRRHAGILRSNPTKENANAAAHYAYYASYDSSHHIATAASRAAVDAAVDAVDAVDAAVDAVDAAAAAAYAASRDAVDAAAADTAYYTIRAASYAVAGRKTEVRPALADLFVSLLDVRS